MSPPISIERAAWVVSLAATAWWFYDAGKDSEIASQYRESIAAEKAAQTAANAAAKAISKIEVQHVQITQPVLREVREKTVYRECRHTTDGLWGVNAALTGATEPPSSGELPAASAAGR